jgi:hypothetical protein
MMNAVEGVGGALGVILLVVLKAGPSSHICYVCAEPA